MPQGPLYLRLAGRGRTKRSHAPRSMPTHKTVKIGGKRRRVPVAYFWKDVIGVGKYRHPVTGQTFTVDEDRINRWVEKYQRMQKRGIEIPTPVDHSDRAEDNRGFVVGARRVGDRLQLLHQVIGEDGARLACRNRCSVYIDPEFTDEHGKNWGEVIAHSAFTPKPVISGQGEFVPFAASRAIGSGKPRKVPVFYLSRQEKTMAARAPGKRRGKKGNTSSSKLSPKKLAKIRKALGIEEDEEVSDEELLKRLASHPAIAKAAKKALEEDADDDEDDAEDEDTDVDDELEDDAEDEDSEEDDEDDADADAEDELEDPEDDDEKDEDDEEDKKKKRGKNRKRVLAERARNRKRELAGSVGSLSRVPKDADPTTLTLLRRSFRTERQKAISKGAITPEVDEALCNLFFKGKQFNGLALSRMPGSEDPLAFRIYSILRKNKPIPLNGGRTGNQEAIALGRKTPGKGDGASLSNKEREAIREEVRAHMGVSGKKKDK